MRVTIQDGVYGLVIEVKIESMFDNGKRHMIRTSSLMLLILSRYRLSRAVNNSRYMSDVVVPRKP